MSSPCCCCCRVCCCNRQAGVAVTLQDTEFNYMGCSNAGLSSHYMNPAQQTCLWANEQRGETALCTNCAIARPGPGNR